MRLSELELAELNEKATLCKCNREKKKVKKHIKSVAESRGISVAECRKDMEYAIKMASEKPTELFIRMYGRRTPSLEEFIYKLLDAVEKEGRNYDA